MQLWPFYADKKSFPPPPPLFRFSGGGGGGLKCRIQIFFDHFADRPNQTPLFVSYVPRNVRVEEETKRELKRKGKRKEEIKKKEPEKVEDPKAALYEPFKCGICDHSTETLGK